MTTKNTQKKNHQKLGISSNCLECKKEIYIKKCLINRKKYCSRRCLGLNTKLVKGEIPRPRNIAWNKGLKGVQKAWNKGLSAVWAKGDKNVNWKGGKTELSQYIRTSMKYSEWRKSIFARDNWRCRDCGVNNNTLQVDHIYPLALIIDSNNITKDNFLECSDLWNTNNGRTLCKACHKKTDTFGVNFIRWNKQTTALSGTPTSLNVTIFYRQDA